MGFVKQALMADLKTFFDARDENTEHCLAGAKSLIELALANDLRNTYITLYFAKRTIETACADFSPTPDFSSVVPAVMQSLVNFRVFTSNPIFVSDRYEEAINFEDDDLEFIYEELQKSKQAFALSSLKIPNDSDETYLSNRGSIPDPMTGEDDLDPLTHIAFEYRWTDLVAPEAKNIMPTTQERLDAAWSLLTDAQKVEAEALAKANAIARTLPETNKE
jgi:hypothetical protein